MMKRMVSAVLLSLLAICGTEAQNTVDNSLTRHDFF